MAKFYQRITLPKEVVTFTTDDLLRKTIKLDDGSYALVKADAGETIDLLQGEQVIVNWESSHYISVTVFNEAVAKKLSKLAVK